MSRPEFVRVRQLEKQVKDEYKLDPSVYHRPIDNNSYEIKIVRKGKEIVLKEVMKHGLTEFATMEYAGIIKQFKRYVDAERAAIELLRS